MSHSSSGSNTLPDALQARLQHVPGGARQKLRWAREIEQASIQPSALADHLISQWGWGHMSATSIQKIAAAAVSDGLQHPEVQRLAALGSHGRYPNHAHRDLTNQLVQTPIKDAVGQIQLTQKYNLAFVTSTHPILLPHELFASMYAHHKEQFVSLLCGGSTDNIGRFWTAMSDHPSYVGSVLSQRTDHKHRAIPLGIHGDGVVVNGVGKS